MPVRSARSLGLIVAVAFALTASAAASAEPLPKPKGEVVLTIGGNISNTNEGEVAQLDGKMLEALGTVKFKSQTPWYEHPIEFEGVPMQALMDYVGAQGTEVAVIAFNDYRSTVPMEDFARFETILAMKRDGQPMSLRDKGPLWLVYPYDSDPELDTDKYYSRSVWQIKRIDVQ